MSIARGQASRALDFADAALDDGPPIMERSMPLPAAPQRRLVEANGIRLHSDGVICTPGTRGAADASPAVLPGLRKTVLLDGIGHWVQQEAARAVNAELIDFLASL
jgi:pimeloyl-ACP methyl ester carboxylesterase